MTECIVSCLCSGYNASGNSSLVSLERSTNPLSTERHIISRCIVNCGDSTQRYCNEKRIKLSSVSCIIITSLAPHNVSGFPGVFLALSDLGVGSISVIGPAGIQSTLDLMLPFTNRKYPALNVVEVDHFTSPEKLIHKTEHFTVRIRPISVSESNSRVIALAASIIVSAWNHTGKENDVTMVSVFPMACYFETFPSLRSMVDDSMVEAGNEYGTVKHKMFLFTPLAVSSFDSHANYDDANAHTQEGHFGELLSLCGEHNAKGMYTAGNLSKNAFECGYSQRMISTLSYLCKPLFPDMILPELASDRPPADIHEDSGDYLRLAAPGLSMSAPVSTATGRTSSQPFPETIFSTDESVVADIVEKSAAARNLYDSAVLPRLTEILAPPRCREQRSAPLPPPPLPLPLPLPPLPPSAFSFGAFNGCENMVVFPPPGFRPPVPPWPSANSLSLAVPEQPPSPMFFMENRASASINSLPSLSDDLSNVSTPSPQTNFAAASMLRANLLQKRRQQDRSDFMETCESTPRDTREVSPSANMIQGYSDASECAPTLTREALAQHPCLALSGRVGAGLGEFEDDSEVRVSPMKSLRLNDSSKQFTFNTTDFSSSLKKSSPIHKAAGGKVRTDQHQDDHVADQQAQNAAFAQSVFQVPPPNPFMDVCSVTFLGTGSATPSKYRNGSCIMLTLNGSQQRRKPSFSDFLSIDTTSSGGSASEAGDASNGGAAFKPSILLDVGEGTAAQIFQSVNGDVARFDQALLSIRVIWISHHHADHITGVPMLIEHIKRAKMRQAAANKGQAEGATQDSKSNSLRRVPTFSKYDMRSMYTSGGYEPGKVMVIGTESVLKYFEFSCCVAGLDDLVSFTPIVSTLYAGCTKEIAAATDGLITHLRSIPVQHCHGSYGLVLDFKSTHKMVYSGDCRPSQSLVKAGIDCDLLIHEATFDDTKQEDAVKKRHSTSSEARRISMQMHAKHTILTHFSQRYPLEVSNALGDLVSAQDGSLTGPMGGVTEAAVAYDFLRFSFPSQVSVLPRVTAALGAVLTAVEAERKALSTAASAGRF